MQEQMLPWVNYNEAMERVRRIDDMAEEQFVMRAVTLVVQRFSSGTFPTARFDMLYFVDVMSELFQQKAALAQILAGEDLRWFTD